MDLNKRDMLKGIGSATVGAATIPAVSSAQSNHSNSKVPSIENIEKIAEEQGVHTFKVDFKSKTVITKVETDDQLLNKEKRGDDQLLNKEKKGASAATFERKVSSEEINTDDVSTSDITTSIETGTMSASSVDVVEDYEEVEGGYGEMCNYVGGSDWSDYEHQVDGTAVKLTDTADDLSAPTVSAAVASVLKLAIGGWITVAGAFVAGAITALSGPVYYFGGRDRDRGCVSGRCGFRTIQYRIGDGGDMSPSPSEFVDTTNPAGSYLPSAIVPSSYPGHISSP